MNYNICIKFEKHFTENYELTFDTNEEAIDEAKDIVIDGFVSIEEVDMPSYCDVDIEKDEKTIYSARLYPCKDGVTEKTFVEQLGDYTVEKTDIGAILTAEDGRFCTFVWDDALEGLIAEDGDLDVDDDQFYQIPELVKIEKEWTEY